MSGLPHHKALLNPELNALMNVTISIIGEKEKVHVPRNIIEKRCPSLFLDVNIIKKKKEKKGDSGIMTVDYKANTFTMAVFHKILEYCYTGTLPFDTMELRDVLVLLRSASKLDCPRLVYLCERRIREILTVDSVFNVLKLSNELGLEDIKKMATSFAHQNWPQFCGHKGGIDIIGIELFQELTIGMQFYKEEEKINTAPDALKVVPCTVVADYRAILKDARFADGDFLFPNPDVAENIKFHRCVVAAHTKPLFQLITSNKSKQYVIDGLSYVATKNLLEYIYFGEVAFDPVGSCKIIENAINQFALQHILDHCIKAISNGITDESSLDILRITYLPNFQTPTMSDLRSKVLKHISLNFKNVDIPSVRGLKPTEIAYEMLADILDQIYYDMPADSARKKPSKKTKKHRVSRTLSSSNAKEEDGKRLGKRTSSSGKMINKH